jgi:hypothetical protein
MKANAQVSDQKIMDYGLPKRSTRPETKRARTANQRIPKWAYLLFILLAGFVTYRIYQHRAIEAKAAQPAPRPASVAKVITKDVPLYLDEIGTCAAYETVQVPAQVSGVIIGRHFQDGSEVKKGKGASRVRCGDAQATRGPACEKGGCAAGLRHCFGERAKVAGSDRSCSGKL